MNTTNKLGRGLSSLLGEKKLNLSSGLMGIDLSADRVQQVSIDMLKPNKFQPRKYFDEAQLKDLSASIKEYGILQPIIVRKLIDKASQFEIIAGERRHRAAKMAGLETVPVIIKEFDDKDVLSLAIIENIQRSDLSVIEEAEAYYCLIKDFNYTQQDVANFVGKSRSHVANIVRLLDLPIEVKDLLYRKQLDMGHARALIGCSKAVEIANLIIKDQLSVRETEKLIKDCNDSKKNLQRNIKKSNLSMANKEYFKKVESTLFDKINLKSKIEFDDQKNKGKIIISYNTLEELEQFLTKIR